MLNKHGWGLKEMILLSGILLIFLVIAIYYVSSIYKDIGEEVTNKYYYQLEDKLKNQVNVYLSDYYGENLTNNKIIVTRSTLRKYNLDISLIDNTGKSCSGYATAYKTVGVTNINAYIKCNNYKTVGYEDGNE